MRRKHTLQPDARMPIGFIIRNLIARGERAAGYYAFIALCWLGCALLWIAKKLSHRRASED